MTGLKAADYWNKRGATYSSAWQSKAKQRLSKLETGLIRRAIDSRQEDVGGEKLKTLDIGAGTGRISAAVLECDVEHYGTDISQTMVGLCRERFAGNPKVKEFRVHNILGPLPKEWGSFDLVTAMRVLSYTPEWREELKNIYEALNPGGILVCTFPNRHSSILLPRLLLQRELPGNEVTYRELKDALHEVGFSQVKIVGFSRLLDTFYDWCDSRISSGVLLGVEKFLGLLFGPTLFVRLFYVVCKK